LESFPRIAFETDYGGESTDPDSFPKQLDARRKVMAEMEAEKLEAPPEMETGDAKATKPQGENRGNGKDSATTPATGRLPARASRI
jgi:hypothetical protein